MTDISIMQFTDNLSFSDVRLVSADPRVIEITGEDFVKARDVIINDQQAPRIEIVSSTKLLAELPISVNAIQSIVIVSSSPTETREATQVVLGTTDVVLKSTGLSALVQRVIKILLTTPGTNVANVDEGAGILTLLGTNSADLGGLTSSISSLIDGVQAYILEDPSYFKLPQSEQLSQIDIETLLWDRETQTVRLAIRISAQDGNSTVSRIEV